MPDESSREYDVVVCGAGMAGLCAAVTALEAGASVLVIEKGSRPGGSMRMSGGTVWTAPSMLVMETWVAGGDRARQRRLVDEIGPGLDWLASHGVAFDEPIANERQVGQQLDVGQLTERLVAAVEERGGRIETETALDRLEMDEVGRCSGLVTRRDRRRRRTGADAVVLATGGFQGNRALMAQFVSRNADRLLIRSNPFSVGDGLLAALAAGARTSRSMDQFYGHTMPAPPADPPPSQWTAVTAYYSQDAVLVNERGERFFDESVSMADERAPQEIVRQSNARAVLVLDDAVYSDRPIAGRSTSAVRANFDNAVAAGAPSAVVGSLLELADVLSTWGISKRGFLATIEEYNDAVRSGQGRELRVPRRRCQIPVLEPPFRALAVRPGITFTMGGIDVDSEARVLDRDGAVIPGLFAAGADAGGTYRGGYMGGLVLGLVQGRIAGAGAASVPRETAAARAAPALLT